MEILPTEISQGEKVLHCLSKKLRDGAQKSKFFFSSACIYRVPKELRNLKESAYTPRLIAIGPLHRNDEHLQTPMQHVKSSYANNLLLRLTEGMEDEFTKQKKITVLGECMAAMKTSLHDAKKCYLEEVALDEEMMLIDGCFILELLYRIYLRRRKKSEELEAGDPIFGSRLTIQRVQHDLLLLENQIPFFVLERLFSLTLARIPYLPQNLSLSDYVILPIVEEVMRPTKVDGTKISWSPRDCVLWVKYHHILHKLHDDYLPPEQKEKEQAVLTEELPSALELVYAGVKFVPGTEKNLFMVKFIEPQGLGRLYQWARFEIPYLEIDDSTELVLRNLIALEQYSPGILCISQHFTSYAKLIDMLVNHDKDVQVLKMAGVLESRLGASEDVTHLFNKLCKEVVITETEFFFGGTCKKAISYSKRVWPRNVAHVRRTYFASPWTFIAFFLAFLAFGITIAEFILNFVKEEHYKY